MTRSHPNTSIITHTTISLAGARKAIAAAQNAAAEHGWAICVAIVDRHGELIALEKDDQAIGISPSVATAKARTAALLQQPSKIFEDFINSGSPSFLSTPNATALEGGVPLTLNHDVIGAIGVSGAHGPNDSFVAEAGANAI